MCVFFPIQFFTIHLRGLDSSARPTDITQIQRPRLFTHAQVDLFQRTNSINIRHFTNANTCPIILAPRQKVILDYSIPKRLPLSPGPLLSLATYPVFIPPQL
mmetsp:Transcript_6788/g.8966  ORF Transcript_6788/g.8966 Transcript_6788/m.8966 type:complete len:102 (+) Transcript_6788:168-473(+)